MVIYSPKKSSRAVLAGLRKYIFCPLPQGHQALKLIDEKQENLDFETRSPD
jgi:hypothetical protein